MARELSRSWPVTLTWHVGRHSGNFNKPVVAFIAGRTAPREKRMGHAGAIIMGSEGTYEEKRKKFEEVGVKVADLPEEVPKLLKEVLG